MACTGCRDGRALDFDFSMAFQPIVDLATMRPYAYEALIRGLNGEGAAEVLARVTPDNLYAFDQRCRVRAIELAARAGILETGARLSINFLPNAVYSPVACIQLTLKTARELDFPTDRLVFEFTENEQMLDPDHVASIAAAYHKMGFGIALDDFGAGHAGLGLLARFQPDTVKLDMELVRGIDASLPRRVIVGGIVDMCRKLGIAVVAEGVETESELAALRALGIGYAQGYLLGRPGFEHLPAVTPPAVPEVAAAA
ncbi:EAL domain-containing protein [Allosphingosinicella indica]|uniref:EAL domain, c-di-GMP-specific phosphodiesterase class I (Or its enzymatically inactive variant) n=1 Tax=Allosphingosinicella indica TaxID=941907 RepID=A0A1X7GJY7_9SPHN|nr:EAL domain-containing protein [Allosphingosinicella indica]SMF70877.1 EAL domain, c-di-GMP-specific phosphodiesterase class I (or its enzymatically inactive variant) [Allosphingosinicella indica]